MNKTIIAAAASVALAVALFLITHQAGTAETFAEWKTLTFHEPAHYIFEFQNEMLVAFIGIPLWRHAKAKAVHRAIREHDAKHHPDSHGVDSHADSVVR
jgi:hypothetical protein